MGDNYLKTFRNDSLLGEKLQKLDTNDLNLLQGIHCEENYEQFYESKKFSRFIWKI